MKQFALFRGHVHYPSGGWADYVDSFDSKEEAVQGLKHDELEARGWWHVVDLTLGEMVLSHRDKEYNDVNRIQEIADELLGTPTCFKSVLELDEIADADVLQVQVEELVMECDVCGWWHDIDDLDDTSGSLICEDCVESHIAEND